MSCLSQSNLFLFLSGLIHSCLFSTQQGLSSKICIVHDVWTTKGGKRAFIGVSVSYIDEDFVFHMYHLTLKLVAWNKYGHLLARPVGRFLIRYGLHKKISPLSFCFSCTCSSTDSLRCLLQLHLVAQATDSGAENHILAYELEKMFMNDTDSVYWNSRRNQIRCYCHKLALTVKLGLEMLGFGVGRSKPSLPNNRKLHLLIPDDAPPPPKIVMKKALVQSTPADDPEINEQDEEVDDVDSDCEAPPDEENPNPTYIDSDHSDDDNETDDQPQNGDQGLLCRALVKVRFFESVFVAVSVVLKLLIFFGLGSADQQVN